MVNKTLPIAKALYPSYSLLFFFDNKTSYFIYAKNALQVKDMSKIAGDQQSWLRNGWFYYHDIQVNQPIDFQRDNRQLT